MTFGEQIKYVRNLLYLSQAEMAKKMTVTEQTIRRWETEKNTPHISARRRFVDFCKKEKIIIPQSTK